VITYTDTTVHLGSDPARVSVLHASTGAFGVVRLPGLIVIATNPTDLRLLAEALTDAARQLSDRLDADAAEQVNKASEQAALAQATA
jgi:hypothetical protein